MSSWQHLKNRLRPLGPPAWRWLKRSLLVGLVAVVLIASATAIAVFGWSYDVTELETGEPIVLTDRHGRMLRTISARHGLPRREAWVELEDLPAIAIATVIFDFLYLLCVNRYN